MKNEYIDGEMLKKAFIGAANHLEQNKEEVDALNVFPVPDGDTGTNMSLTVQSAIKEILNLNEYNVDKIALAASNGSLMGARGNSGVILSQLYRGLSNGLKGKEKADVEILAEAFKLASETAYKAVMKPTEGTILTVARGCAEKALEISKTEKDIIVFMSKVIEHGNNVLNKTPEMLPVLKEAGVVDAGGKGLMVILEGSFKALTTHGEIKYEPLTAKKEGVHVDHDVSTGDIKYGYCTEFIIKNTNADVEEFKKELSLFGDSLMAVGGENMIKVHVHTNNPGLVLEKGLAIGDLNAIKIDNMRVQHRNLLIEDKNNVNENKVIDLDEKKKEPKKYSFITVAMGDGLSDVFKDLKVDYIIPGGQTMNPSTEDIVNAIDKVEGEHIIILPNNGNIVLAAEQAKNISKRNIHVFPTKSIPEGVVALLNFDFEKEIEENLKAMESAVENVKTGQVTYAVRNTEINGKKIKKDDIIGIFKGDIISNGEDKQKVALELVKNIADEDSEIITIFYGNEINEEEANELSEMIEDEIKDCDVEVVYGGQPLYYYIFSIE